MIFFVAEKYLEIGLLSTAFLEQSLSVKIFWNDNNECCLVAPMATNLLAEMRMVETWNSTNPRLIDVLWTIHENSFCPFHKSQWKTGAGLMFFHFIDHTWRAKKDYSTSSRYSTYFLVSKSVCVESDDNNRKWNYNLNQNLLITTSKYFCYCGKNRNLISRLSAGCIPKSSFAWCWYENCRITLLSWWKTNDGSNRASRQSKALLIPRQQIPR